MARNRRIQIYVLKGKKDMSNVVDVINGQSFQEDRTNLERLQIIVFGATVELQLRCE